jgi:predicted adenine nucleotide alpha hydrolase (AANH) superfamily ATPase
LIINDSYLEDLWVSNGNIRCAFCYEERIKYLVTYASEHGYDTFLTSLLASPYQQHDTIIALCKQYANAYDIDFHYVDNRDFYHESKREARALGIYIQKYCGCIFSKEAVMSND